MNTTWYADRRITRISLIKKQMFFRGPPNQAISVSMVFLILRAPSARTPEGRDITPPRALDPEELEPGALA